ncbi:MAG: hypothetical protein MUQ65_06905, partial [Armatimonadetes bacterium]|nr:hypothetical protein [Armatimonadota bacterium]
FGVRFLHIFLVVPLLPEEPKQTTGALVRHLVRWPFVSVASVLGGRGREESRAEEGNARNARTQEREAPGTDE